MMVNKKRNPRFRDDILVIRRMKESYLRINKKYDYALQEIKESRGVKTISQSTNELTEIFKSPWNKL